MSPNSVAILGSGLILFIVHALPWLARNSPTLVRNPAKLSAMLSGLQVIPHFIVVAIWPQESVIFPAYGDAVRELLPRFGLYYACGFLALLIGIQWGVRPRHNAEPISIAYQPNYYMISALMFALYLVAMFLMISRAGGINVFIANFGTQNEFHWGTGLFQIIKIPAAYLSILFLAVQHARTGKPHMMWLVAYIMLLVLIESGLGGRRGPIQMVLFAIVAIHMVNPHKKLVSATNVALAAVCATIFVVLLILRDQASGYNESRGVLAYIVNFSYNDIYMFVLDHFSRNDLWLGKVFLDFQYRIFPGPFIYLRPPSLDEGVYIYNLYLGRAVDPPVSPELLAENSWPPRTFGNGFMNFGFLGILGFFLFQGFLTGLVYRLAYRSNFNPALVFLFLMFIFSFQVSNLKITEMIFIMIGLGLMFGPGIIAKNMLSLQDAKTRNRRVF